MGQLDLFDADGVEQLKGVSETHDGGQPDGSDGPTRVPMKVSPTRVTVSDRRHSSADPGTDRDVSQQAHNAAVTDDSGFDFDATAANAEVALSALKWVEQARARDVLSVWGGMDADFRLSYVQMWVLNNPRALNDPLTGGASREQLAEQLAALPPAHPLWPHLERVLRRDLVDVIARMFDDRELGTGTRPRLVAPGLELIRVTPVDQVPQQADGTHVWESDTAVQSLSLFLSLGPAGWLVAGWGDGVMRPGWPPQHEVLATPAD